MGGRRISRSTFEHDRHSYAHKRGSRVGFATDPTEREEAPEKDSGGTMSQLSGTQGSSQYNSASGTKSTELAMSTNIEAQIGGRRVAFGRRTVAWW